MARSVTPIAETVCRVTMSVLKALAGPAVPAYAAPPPLAALPPSNLRTMGQPLRYGGRKRGGKKMRTQKKRRSH